MVGPTIGHYYIGGMRDHPGGCLFSQCFLPVFSPVHLQVQRCCGAPRVVGSRAQALSDPYYQYACLSVILSFCPSVRNFGPKYLGNEAR